MEREIWVAKDSVLRSKEYLHWLAKRMRELGITRMGGFIFLLEHLTEHLQAGGIIRDAKGRIITLGDDAIENAFFGELSFSWHSDFQVFVDRMPMRRAKRRLIPRLILWDAALRIHDRRYY